MQTMTADEKPIMQKWSTTAGPRQSKQVSDALSKLKWLRTEFIEWNGTKHKDGTTTNERRTRLNCPIGGDVNPAVLTEEKHIFDKYAGTITRENYAAIIADAEAAQARIIAALPVVDERREAEEVNEQAARVQEAAAKRKLAEEATATSHAVIMAKRPANAAALIVAIESEDTSDSMSDYHGHKDKRMVAIGWRTGVKEDFKQLCKAAGSFPETAHLQHGKAYKAWVYFTEEKRQGHYLEDPNGRPLTFPTDTALFAFMDEFKKGDTSDAIRAASYGYQDNLEDYCHRENYSMGHGNYLKAGHVDGNGWRVESMSLPLSVNTCGALPMEDHLLSADPDTVQPAGFRGTGAAVAGCEVQKHYHSKHNFDFFMVVLQMRVEREEFERLRAGCQDMGGWYSRAWGKVPGGFAFKDHAKALEFAVKYVPGNGPPTGGGEPVPAPGEESQAPAGWDQHDTATEAPAPALRQVSGPEQAAAARAAVAKELEDKADAMQETIDYKFNPGCANQNPTRRRIEMAKGMRADGERLAHVQSALRALAALWRTNSVPTELATLKTKGAVEAVMHYRSETARQYGKATILRQYHLLADAIAHHATHDKDAEKERQDAEELRQLENRVRFCDIPGFFPTPDHVAEDMARKLDIRAGMSVLEPSAGIGHLVEAVMQQSTAETWKNIWAVECHFTLVDILKKKAAKWDESFPARVLTQDFGFFVKRCLCGEPSGNAFQPMQFDRIIMNPPFENGQDGEHIQLAYTLLKPGGRMVALCSTGLLYTQSNKNLEFWKWLRTTDYTTEDLEAGSFKSSFRPTGVNVVMLVIDAPGAA